MSGNATSTEEVTMSDSSSDEDREDNGTGRGNISGYSSEEILMSDDSSDEDSTDDSSDEDSTDDDTDIDSLSDYLTEYLVQRRNQAASSSAISVLPEERRIEEITFAAQVSVSMGTTSVESPMSDNLYSGTEDSTDIDQSDDESLDIVQVEGNEAPVAPQDNTSSETDSSVVPPDSSSTAAGSSTSRPVEVFSGTASETDIIEVQSDGVSSETSPTVASSETSPTAASSETSPTAAPQPAEVSMHPSPQPVRGVSENEPSVPSAESDPVAQLRALPPDVNPSPKRRRVITPEKKSPEKKGNLNQTVEDEDVCSICFDSWTTSGDHRPASLKCGHLFGYMCIDKWLKGRGEKCPQCNAKAKRPDIRIIFTRNIKAVDTTERDRALEQLTQVQKRNTELMMETAQLGLKYHVVMSECSRLQNELRDAKQEVFGLKCRLNGNEGKSTSDSVNSQDAVGAVGNEMMDLTNIPKEEGMFVLKKNIIIFAGGNCRVMTHSPFLGTIAVSQPSSIALFPGFGIKKISTLDPKTTEYMTLHSKAIRNLCFHPTHQDGVLLSCSLDKTVKLTSMISNSVVQCYNLPVGAWSCIWNTDNHNCFYVGLQNGTVQEYDIRNTDSCVVELNSGGVHSPVASLQYVPACPNATFRPAGLLVGQLNQVSFYEKLPGNEYKTHLLPCEGNISSLNFDTHTRQMLASFRSSIRHPKVRHMVCELGMIDNSVCGCNVIQTFYGGSTQTLLSRSLLVPHPKNNDHRLVCAGDEASKGVKIWNGNSFRFNQDLPCEGAVVDLCYIDQNQQYLCALTDKRLRFHEWKE